MLVNLGTYDNFGGTQEFKIDCEKHTAFWGKSGVGKSTALARIIISHIQEGYGLSVLDPHGPLIDEIMRHIPKSRMDDVIYYDPASDDLISLNPFHSKDRHRGVDDFGFIISKIWEKGWGPQTDFIYTNAALACNLYTQWPTILNLHRFLMKPGYRRMLFRLDLQRRKHGYDIEYPELLDFRDMYDGVFDSEGKKIFGWDQKQREAASAPLLNKVNKFISNPILRRSLGLYTGLSFKRVMDKNKILLCRLSKGALGRDTSSLLGSLIISKLSLAAMQRDKPSRPHLIFADEVQNFVHGIDFPTILAEARKYGLTLFIATQTLEQMPDPEAVFGNCSNLISFRVGGEDAEKIAKNFGNERLGPVLVGTSDFEFYASVVLNHLATQSAIVKLNPAIGFTGNEADPQDVIRTSAKRWAQPRAEVDEKIRRFLAS